MTVKILTFLAEQRVTMSRDNIELHEIDLSQYANQEAWFETFGEGPGFTDNFGGVESNLDLNLSFGDQEENDADCLVGEPSLDLNLSFGDQEANGADCLVGEPSLDLNLSFGDQEANGADCLVGEPSLDLNLSFGDQEEKGINSSTADCLEEEPSLDLDLSFGEQDVKGLNDYFEGEPNLDLDLSFGEQDDKGPNLDLNMSFDGKNITKDERKLANVHNNVGVCIDFEGDDKLSLQNEETFKTNKRGREDDQPKHENMKKRKVIQNS